MRAVVVLGDGDVARSVVESLARKSVPTDLVYTKARDHARFSRFARRSVRLPEPLTDESRVADFLLTSPRIDDGSFLLPCTDAAVVFAARRQRELSARFVVGAPEWDVLRRVLDKGILYRTAVAVGVPTPAVAWPRSEDDVEQALQEIPLPALVKPTQTHLFFRVFRCKLFVVRSARELRDALRRAWRHGLEVMLTELIPGPDSALFQHLCYVTGDGHIPVEMCTQKLRQCPQGFGVGCFCRTCAMVPEVRDRSRRLLERLAYRGIASSEFKHDARDGRFKLMEINVRPVLTHRLLTRVGFDQAYFAYQERMLGRSPEFHGAPAEVYWQHNFLELVRLLGFRDLRLTEYVAGLVRRNAIAAPLARDPLPYLVRAAMYLLDWARGVRPTAP